MGAAGVPGASSWVRGCSLPQHSQCLGILTLVSLVWIRSLSSHLLEWPHSYHLELWSWKGKCRGEAWTPSARVQTCQGQAQTRMRPRVRHLPAGRGCVLTAPLALAGDHLVQLAPSPHPQDQGDTGHAVYLPWSWVDACPACTPAPSAVESRQADVRLAGRADDHMSGA